VIRPLPARVCAPLASPLGVGAPVPPSHGLRSRRRRVLHHVHERYTLTTIAETLSSAKRAELQTIPAAEAAAQLAAVAAQSEAERAATLAYLQSQGWKTYEGMSVALCPICNEVGARFVARRLRDEHSPMIVRCTACAGKRQAS